MLNSYRRRAFILITFAALEQTTAHAHAAASEPDSLWDILARAKSLTVTNPQQSRNNSPFSTEQPARQSLGPVPGFSLPAAHAQEPSIDSVFNKKKPKRSAGFFGSVGDWFNRLQASTGSKIQATGHHTFSLRVDSISGGASATEGFQNEQYFGRGSNGLYSDTDMTIDATLFKHLHYSARISNNLFSNPNDNRVKLDYNTKKLRVEWGDINAGFQGNSLIDFNRYLSGMKVTNEWSRQFRTSLIYSQTKAETRSLQFPGNGSSGPYLAFLGQVVEGSDHVRVDNRDMVKGQDYTLDSYTGELRFLNGNIVLPSSTIAITFETLGYNISRGNIYGVRTEFSPKGSSRVGMTFVTQNSKGSQGLQTHTQDFYGLGTSPYALDQVPDPTKPITLTVDGIPQIQGIDFVVDPQRQNLIHLTQIVIGTSHLIKITYFPYNNTPTPGNRSVLGFDGNVPLGKLGSISLESAFSGLNLQGNDIGGNAWQIRADLNPARNLRSTINLRNISPTFSSIQSPGFSRNEKAIEFSSDYNPTKNLHLNLNWQKAKRPAYTSSVGTGLYTISPVGLMTTTSMVWA